MFYEETVIDGRLHCRTTPGGRWHEVDLRTMTRYLAERDVRIATLEAQLAAACL